MKEVAELVNDALQGCTPTSNEHRHLPHDLQFWYWQLIYILTSIYPN